VPAAFKAATQYNDANKKGIKKIEVIDHSWPTSLREILANELQDVNGQSIEQNIGKFQELEKHVDFVFLLDEILAPTLYAAHWFGVANEGKNIERLKGVFGGFPDEDRRQEQRRKARKKFKDKDLNLGKITDNDPIILVQGGGTPVWKQFLGKLVEAFTKSKHKHPFCVLFTEPGLRGADPTGRLLQTVCETKRLGAVTDQLFPNLQEVFVGVDLVYTRAGAMSVQDAIACRTPVVCVEEPGQWQTEQIRKQCTEAKLTRTVKFDVFRYAPLGSVYNELCDDSGNDLITGKMKSILNLQETELAQKILRCI